MSHSLSHYTQPISSRTHCRCYLHLCFNNIDAEVAVAGGFGFAECDGGCFAELYWKAAYLRYPNLCPETSGLGPER